MGPQPRYLTSPVAQGAVWVLRRCDEMARMARVTLTAVLGHPDPGGRPSRAHGQGVTHSSGTVDLLSRLPGEDMLPSVGCGDAESRRESVWVSPGKPGEGAACLQPICLLHLGLWLLLEQRSSCARPAQGTSRCQGQLLLSSALCNLPRPGPGAASWGDGPGLPCRPPWWSHCKVIVSSWPCSRQ